MTSLMRTLWKNTRLGPKMIGVESQTQLFRLVNLQTVASPEYIQDQSLANMRENI